MWHESRLACAVLTERRHVKWSIQVQLLEVSDLVTCIDSHELCTTQCVLFQTGSPEKHYNSSLLDASNRVAGLAKTKQPSALKMKRVYFSKTLTSPDESTRRENPEEDHHPRRRDNLKSHKNYTARPIETQTFAPQPCFQDLGERGRPLRDGMKQEQTT
jgi:hypothetical protein